MEILPVFKHALMIKAFNLVFGLGVGGRCWHVGYDCIRLLRAR
jgi:hypothetical protein